MFRKNTKCRKCVFSKQSDGETTYLCYLNPFKPVVMSHFSEHSDRKNKKKEQLKKDS